MDDRDTKLNLSHETNHAFCWIVRDVARELQISERHVLRLVAERKIPFARIGRLLRFSPARIAEWIAKGGTS